LQEQLRRFLSHLEAQKTGVCKKCGVEGTNLKEDGICPACRWKLKPTPVKVFKNEEKRERTETWHDREP
jgi:rubrerythrin